MLKEQANASVVISILAYESEDLVSSPCLDACRLGDMTQ